MTFADRLRNIQAETRASAYGDNFYVEVLNRCSYVAKDSATRNSAAIEIASYAVSVTNQVCSLKKVVKPTCKSLISTIEKLKKEGLTVSFELNETWGCVYMFVKWGE